MWKSWPIELFFTQNWFILFAVRPRYAAGGHLSFSTSEIPSFFFIFLIFFYKKALTNPFRVDILVEPL
jgi:hypothetical protein